MEKKCIRIKPYYHILQHGEVIDFIKTLDEGIKLPAGDFFNGFMKCIGQTPAEEDLLIQLALELPLTPGTAKQFLEKLFELGVIEYYYENEILAPVNRYHRQLLFFDTIDPQKDFTDNDAKQEKLSKAHVMIMGIGGIGNFMALALVAAGIGKITLVDFDTVEETNLNRQVLFGENDIGKGKTEAATLRLKEVHGSCVISSHAKYIASQCDFDVLLHEAGETHYVVLSADQPVDLVLWASSLCKKYGFKYLKCGYMTYQGLIGPLLGPDTRAYEEIFQSWSEDIRNQPDLIKAQNHSHIAASMAATNAILANIAALEIIKDITGIIPSLLIEKRLLLNFKTMDLCYG